MKILWVTNDLKPYTNANSAIVYKISRYLYHKYGIKVVLLGYQSASIVESKQNEEFTTYYIKEQYNYKKLIPPSLPTYLKILYLIFHPSCLIRRILRTLTRYPQCREYQRHIRTVLLKEPDIDCILCVASPYDTICAGVKEHGSIPLISYKLDPWGSHYLHKNDIRYKKDEDLADSQCAYILVTPQIYQEYKSLKQPNLLLHKIRSCEFPNIEKPNGIVEKEAWCSQNMRNCVFVGQLYDDIRSPAFLFNLFNKLNINQIPVLLHIVGNSKTQKYQSTLSPNVILHGRVSPKKASAYIQHADILVNIGNTIPNQMPSKVIEYIASGKPILNICKIAQCPTLRYLEKYPASLTIMEAEGINDKTLSKVTDFCMTNKHKDISFEEIKNLYPKCTPEYVGDTIFHIITSIIKNKRKCG